MKEQTEKKPLMSRDTKRAEQWILNHISVFGASTREDIALGAKHRWRCIGLSSRLDDLERKGLIYYCPRERAFVLTPKGEEEVA